MSPERKSDAGLVARWSRLSLRAKGVVVLVLPLSALMIAIFAMYSAARTGAQNDRAMDSAYDARAELLHIVNVLLDAHAAATTYVANRDSAAAAQVDAAGASVDRSIARLRSSGGERMAAEVRAPARRFFDILGEVRAARGRPEIQTGALKRAKALLSEIQPRINQIVHEQDLRLLDARIARDTAGRSLFRVVLACGVIGPLGALFLHLLIAGRLVHRLAAVEENARRLAHGLPLEPSIQGTDEIAALSRQIDSAAYLLRERERKLVESEQRYRDLFDHAPIPYEETDRDGEIRRFNQAVCTLLKSTPDRILGRRAWDFVAPNAQEAFRTALMDRLARGVESEPYECDYLLDDGSHIVVEIHENFIRNSNGEVTGVCRSLLDVTERNLAAVAARKVEQYAMELRNKNEQLARALDAARSATEAKSRFLAAVSHELRTPLNGIIGFSELMYDGKVGPISDDHREFLADILASSRHLLRLINDILDLNKVESGKMEFFPEPRSIAALVAEVRDVVWPLAVKKELRLTTDVPEDLHAVVDSARFKQILYNYLSNAVKFTPPAGSVRLRVTVEDGQFIRADVEDTGTGIDPEEIKRLFQEFQQLPNSRNAGQGAGLGLALTKRIVEAQGGKVSVRSQVGRGSVFSATLPLVRVAQPATTR